MTQAEFELAQKLMALRIAYQALSKVPSKSAELEDILLRIRRLMELRRQQVNEILAD